MGDSLIEQLRQVGVVLGLEKFENKQESEIVVVQNLMAALDLQGAVFSWDSLHCQKKPDVPTKASVADMHDSWY